MENRRNRSVYENNEGTKRSGGVRRPVNRDDEHTDIRRELTDSEKRRRLERQQSRERLRQRQLQAAAAVVGAAIITVIVLFMTPIFDIRQIKVNGNNNIGINMIQEQIGGLVGENLFKTSIGKIENALCAIPQIDSVTVTKQYFPPTVTVDIKEAVPAAYVLSNSKIVVVSVDLKAIDDANVFDHDSLPSISGISVPSYELNKPLTTDSAEKEDILKSLLGALNNAGLLDKVTYISVDDITSISFNYDNRIDVLCGSQLELERKVRMLAEAINSESMKSNSQGTIDLSVPGRAVYTP